MISEWKTDIEATDWNGVVSHRVSSKYGGDFRKSLDLLVTVWTQYGSDAGATIGVFQYFVFFSVKSLNSKLPRKNFSAAFVQKGIF